MTSALMATDDVERLQARLTALEQERKHLLAAIGAIFLRTFRDGPSFSAADLQFCQVVANLTAKALRNAHRFERLRKRKGEDEDTRRREQEQSALIGFMRRLLAAYPPPSDEEP